MISEILKDSWKFQLLTPDLSISVSWEFGNIILDHWLSNFLKQQNFFFFNQAKFILETKGIKEIKMKLAERDGRIGYLILS